MFANQPEHAQRTSQANTHQLVYLLTCAGAIPFVVLSWYLIVTRKVEPWAVKALTSYGAIILSFLGGIHWGRGIETNYPARFWFAIVMSLYGWLAYLTPWPAAPTLLAVGFAGAWWIDHRDANLPKRYKFLRLSVTAVVAVHLLLAASLA